MVNLSGSRILIQKMESFFPIKVIVWVALSSCVEKSKIARLFNSLLSFQTGFLKRSNCSNSVSQIV